MVLHLTGKLVEHTQDIAHAGTYPVSDLSREIADKQNIYCFKLLFSTTETTKFSHKSCLGHLNLQAQNADFPVWVLRHKYKLDLLFPIVLRTNPPNLQLLPTALGSTQIGKFVKCMGDFFIRAVRSTVKLEVPRRLIPAHPCTSNFPIWGSTTHPPIIALLSCHAGLAPGIF